jgi:hypothetical protein
MIATAQHVPPAHLAGGGIEMIEPPCRFDRLTETVRGLLALGYRPRLVARWARRTWDAQSGGRDTLPLATLVALGVRAAPDGSAPTPYHERMRGQKRGRKPMIDEVRLPGMVAAGMSDAEIAVVFGVLPISVYNKRRLMGLKR